MKFGCYKVNFPRKQNFNIHIMKLFVKDNFLLGQLSKISSNIVDINQFIIKYVRNVFEEYINILK